MDAKQHPVNDRVFQHQQINEQASHKALAELQSLPPSSIGSGMEKGHKGQSERKSSVAGHSSKFIEATPLNQTERVIANMLEADIYRGDLSGLDSDLARFHGHGAELRRPLDVVGKEVTDRGFFYTFSEGKKQSHDGKTDDVMVEVSSPKSLMLQFADSDPVQARIYRRQMEAAAD